MGNLGGLDEDAKQEIRDDEPDAKVTSFEQKKAKRRPFHYWKVGDRDYKLKLTTRMIEKLENKYRKNVLDLVTGDDIPPLSVMLTVVHAAMSPWEHGIDYNDIKTLYDRWTEEGGNQIDFCTGVVMPILAVSGFFPEKQAESMMRSLQDTDELM